uniref:50S ribosomal protein L7/L12 n=1 Tax=Clastoptera arizonana TaxID=38151 RepID=A0A1B6E931_9HEMI
MNINEIIKVIESLNIIELNNLVKEFEKKFNISINNFINQNNNINNNQNIKENNNIEKKNEFSILLKEVGEKKISIIKIIREITNLGLREAKELVDKAPKIIKEKLTKIEAEEIKKKLENAGAKVILN